MDLIDVITSQSHQYSRVGKSPIQFSYQNIANSFRNFYFYILIISEISQFVQNSNLLFPRNTQVLRLSEYEKSFFYPACLFVVFVVCRHDNFLMNLGKRSDIGQEYRKFDHF